LYANETAMTTVTALTADSFFLFSDHTLLVDMAVSVQYNTKFLLLLPPV